MTCSITRLKSSTSMIASASRKSKGSSRERPQTTRSKKIANRKKRDSFSFLKVATLSQQFGGKQMPFTLMTPSSDDVTLQKIARLIDDAKAGLALTVNLAL